jgi:hypothetical protein
MALLCGEPGVDGQGDAGHEGCGIARQEEDGVGNFAGVPDAPHGVEVAHVGDGIGVASGEAVEHLRFNGRRGDGVDADARLGHFEGGGFREAFDGVFGGDIESGSGHADESGDAAGVDDRTAATFQHRGDLVFHAGDDTPDVGVENFAVVGFGGLGDGARDLDPGIVEGNVEAAVGGDGLLDEGLDLRFLRGIRGKEGGLSAGGFDFCHDGLAFGLATPAHDDFGSGLAESEGAGFADAAGGSGDEDDFVFKGWVHVGGS